MGQIEQFWCLSDREFPEFFKNGPTFYSSSTQWPSVTIFHKSQFFLGHPVHLYLAVLYISDNPLLQIIVVVVIITTIVGVVTTTNFTLSLDKD